MSLSAVRPYMRARLNSLGYKEWSDGFNFENIPENIVDKAYHLDNFSGTKVKMDQANLTMTVDMTSRVFLKGYRTIKDALDSADEKLQAILVEVLKPTNRLTGTTGVRDIQFVEFVKEPIALSNDNSIILNIKWLVTVNICIT